MKKISTLALALIAMGSLSMPASAQVKFEPVSSIDASGWYKMRLIGSKFNENVSSSAPMYVYSLAQATSDKHIFGTSAEEQSDLSAYVYIDKSGNSYAIRNMNGKYGDKKAQSSDTRVDLSISVKSSDDKTFLVGPYWDDYKKGNIGKFDKDDKGAFQFSKMEDDVLKQYDVYSVTITGYDAATLTCNNSANGGLKTIYNGGSFFVKADTKLEESNFSATEVKGYDNPVSIDAKAKTIKVTYTLNLTGLVDEAKEAISHTSAGYPLEGSTSRTNLQNAINAANGTGDVQTKFTKLNEALDAYKNDKVVKMPEDGKVYLLTNVQIDGTCYHFSYSTGRLAAVKDKAKAAKFVCRVVNDKYVFVNADDGKYLVVAATGNSGTNGGKGYITEYNAQWANLTLSKNSMFSCFDIGGRRYTDAQKPNPADQFGNFIIDKKDGKFNGIGMTEYNKADHTTAFRLEEVTYPNTVTFNAVSDVEGVSHLATFSAPFATVIPTGVKAYYVSTADNSQATMKAVEGEAIPAKTGVLLTSESADAVTMVPATDETLATIENNKLGNSAGTAKTIAADDHAYILSAVDGQTAFYKGKVGTTLGMNKAYLTLNEAGAPEAISMNFGGNVTGINQIVNAEQNNAPVYDLTGRRVVRTVKGGLYIKGGNKFIAR